MSLILLNSLLAASAIKLFWLMNADTPFFCVVSFRPGMLYIKMENNAGYFTLNADSPFSIAIVSIEKKSFSNLSTGTSTFIFETSGPLLSLEHEKNKKILKNNTTVVRIGMINDSNYSMLHTKIMERKI